LQDWVFIVYLKMDFGIIPQADALEQGLAGINPNTIQTAIVEGPLVERVQRNTARSSST